MINILKSTAEVEASCQELSRRGLFLHQTPQKNWDHVQLLELLSDVPKTARILDMGSGGGYTLKVLHQSGYENISGLDLQVPAKRLKHRLAHFLRPSVFQPRYCIDEGDICDTGLEAEAYDFITCVSVLEHGVDVEGFLRESARLLRVGGILFVTVDYWEDFDASDTSVPAVCGLPWNIFNREILGSTLSCAEKYSLRAVSSSKIPACGDRPVSYAGRDYTFAALALKKTAPSE